MCLCVSNTISAVPDIKTSMQHFSHVKIIYSGNFIPNNAFCCVALCLE